LDEVVREKNDWDEDDKMNLVIKRDTQTHITESGDLRFVMRKI